MSSQELAASMSFPLGNAVMKIAEANEKNGAAGIELLTEAIESIKLEVGVRKKKLPKPKVAAKAPAKTTVRAPANKTSAVVKASDTPKTAKPKVEPKAKAESKAKEVVSKKEEDLFGDMGEIEDPAAPDSDIDDLM